MTTSDLVYHIHIIRYKAIYIDLINRSFGFVLSFIFKNIPPQFIRHRIIWGKFLLEEKLQTHVPSKSPSQLIKIFHFLFQHFYYFYFTFYCLTYISSFLSRWKSENHNIIIYLRSRSAISFLRLHRIQLLRSLIRKDHLQTFH